MSVLQIDIECLRWKQDTKNIKFSTCPAYQEIW